MQGVGLHTDNVGISSQTVVALGSCLSLLCTGSYSLERAVAGTSDQTVVALGLCLRVSRFKHQIPDDSRPGQVFARETRLCIYSGQPLYVAGTSYQRVVALGWCLRVKRACTTSSFNYSAPIVTLDWCLFVLYTSAYPSVNCSWCSCMNTSYRIVDS